MLNETCRSKDDGSATLTFDSNVDTANGFEMRYFIYQNTTGAASPQDAFQGPTDSPNPPQAFDDLILGSLIDNGDGTFSGSTLKNLEAGQYYILYQEVNFTTNPVTVKSGELTPEFIIINQPTEVDASSSDLTQPTCAGDDALINFSAVGGNNLDPSGTYSYEYRINGGQWETATDNPQAIAPTTVAQDIEVRAIYTVNNRDCEGPFVNLGAITPGRPPLAFSDPQPGVASSPVATDGEIRASFNGGTAPYTFTLAELNGTTGNFEPVNNPNIQVNNILDQVSVLDLGIGTYRITITDTNGCSETTEDIEVTAIPLPTIDPPVMVREISCTDGTDGAISVTVNGGVAPYEFRWTRDGMPFPLGTSFDLSGLDDGEYELTVASQGGDLNDPNVTVSTSVVLDNPDPIQVIDAMPTDIDCNGAANGSVLVDVTGGTDYQYLISTDILFGDAVLTPLPPDNTIPIATAGSYNLIVGVTRNNVFCESNLVQNIAVGEPDALVLSGQSITDVTTNGGSDGAITVTIQGGTPDNTGDYGYQWSGPNGFAETTRDISGLLAGTYTLSVTDANNCPFTQDFVVDEPRPLTVDALISVPLECAGDDFGEITALPDGGVPPYTYQWFQITNGNPVDLNAGTEVLRNLGEGDYFVRLTDATNTTVDSGTQTLVAPDLLQIGLEDRTDIVCNDDVTGAIDISVTGGTPPYRFLWSNGATTEDIGQLAAGDYTLGVSDANDCFTERTFTLAPPPDALLIAGAVVTDVSQFAGSDGSIVLDIVGGNPPYTIVWTRLSDNAILGDTPTIDNLTADDYQVEVSDGSCALVDTFEVVQPDVVEATIVQPSCAGFSDASISLLVNQGMGSFTYQWSNGATTDVIGGLAAGTYTVTIGGFGGNPLVRSFEIIDPDPLAIGLGGDRVLCAGQVLPLDISVNDPTAVYQWSSDNGFSSDSPTVTLDRSGTYTATISTDTGCTASESITIEALDQEVGAEFAVSSQAFVGETVVAVDISYPIPETLQWNVPEGATILASDSDELQLVFDSPGEYEIGISTTVGRCTAEQVKKVLILEKEGSVEQGGAESTPGKAVESFVLLPNPSDGRFSAEVRLTDPAAISVRVFSFANNALMAAANAQGEQAYSLPFDLSAMPSGVYAVLLETPYGNRLQKIIIR